MIINSILPYIDIASSWAPKAIMQKMDRKFGSDIYVTKKTSIATYRDLYSGGEHFIHFKYSGILNVVYLTCMYGVGMPILFPIAAFNFIN
jgi:hypothetical protein